MSKPSSSVADPVSIPPVSPTAENAPPDSPEAVPIEETAPTLDQDPELINPPKEPAS